MIYKYIPVYSHAKQRPGYQYGFSNKANNFDLTQKSVNQQVTLNVKCY